MCIRDRTGAGGVLDLINQKLQQSDDSTLQQITAVQTGSTCLLYTSRCV